MRAVLTFHSIDNSGSVLSYPVALFDRLLATLAAVEIPVLSLEQLLVDPERSGVALTFDDGMRSVYEQALPIMRNYGATGHVFITTGAVGGNEQWPRQPADVPGFDMLSWSEIEQLHDSGISIDAHTCTHPNMRSLTRQQIQDECEGADQELECRLGKRPDYFAYPFGFHNPVARDYIRGRYRAAVTTELRGLSRQEDLAALPRLDSYYLQSSWALANLDTLPMRGYLWLRWLLRTMRGSHYIAGCR